MNQQEAVPTAEPAIKTPKQELELFDNRKRLREEQERTCETALPFSKRTAWRKRHMYRGWMLEPVESHHEPVAGSSPFSITRSNYGYRVLNSPDLGIIDVDYDGGFGISHLHVAAQQKEAIANIGAWVDSHPEQSWRVYRTAAGLRLIRTDAPQPLDDSYDEVCNAIADADDLYRRLCKEQNAFRARISAKPARCGAEYPHWGVYDDGDGWYGHPPTDADILAYETAAQNYKVAELIEWVGSGEVSPQLVPALDYHDKSCGVESALPVEQPAQSEYALVSNVAELVAFNDVYRPQGMAPDQVWDSLDDVARRNLRDLEGRRGQVIAAYKRLDWLAHKYKFVDYKDFDCWYDTASAKYKEDAMRYVWVSSPGEVTYGGVTHGHWQSLEDSVFPHDPRYWQLENLTAAVTTSAVIRFLPSRDNQRHVQKQVLGAMKHYVSNILVVNDPKTPANNGKVFLFRYGFTIERKIKDLTDPPPEFTNMIPIDPWDMKTGAILMLRACLIDGMVNLGKSSFDMVDGINTEAPVGEDGVIADLLTRVYSLDEA